MKEKIKRASVQLKIALFLKKFSFCSSSSSKHCNEFDTAEYAKDIANGTSTKWENVYSKGCV